jgi:hypothetical protein
MSSPLPWERQARRGIQEPAKAYRAFCVYRELGPSRSIDAAANVLRSPKQAPRGPQNSKTGRAGGTIKQWARTWRWVERAAAWDAELERQRRETEIAEVRAMAKRQAAQAQKVQDGLLISVTELLARLQKPGAMEKVKTGDLLVLVAHAARALPNIQKAERVARIGGDGMLPATPLESNEVLDDLEVQWQSPAKLPAKR